ncbi:MAG TPA: hypothetical protein VGK99_23220 [Acidobacteriota bacterium]|jgi:hypothetical protein
MEKIDRLGWTDGISFSAFGVRLGIRLNDGSLLDRIRTFIPPGSKPANSPVVDHLYSLMTGRETRAKVRRFNLLYSGAGRLARTLDLEEALAALESDLGLYIAEFARQRLFVHAGVVGWQGKAIVIPGRSFSGKSTLVAALLRAGAVYYSDEYAVFDSLGRVHPFPRPLSLRSKGDCSVAHVPSESFGSSAGIKPLPVALVVGSDYAPNAKWRPRTLSLGQGVLLLLNNTVAARNRPKAALATLRRVVSDAKIIRSKRPEAEKTAELLLQAMLATGRPE